MPQATMHDGERPAFHRHFYRGVPYNQVRAAGPEMAEADETDAAMAYCADRFRSFDPSTGTYLGYDGNEHACP